MKFIVKNLCLILVLIPFYLTGQNTTLKRACLPCDQLKELHLPNVTILKAEALAVDTANSINVPFCRVAGLISKEINFELLLPQQWNGRFLMSGGGGFVGEIQNFLKNYVNDGYATVGTDTGHRGGDNAVWALNNMERQLNFGRLAVHLTAVVSKSLIHTNYCAEPTFSYFMGCSRGGGQAMVEAQFYPEDFDGIVAGAPAYRWPDLGAKFIQGCQNNYPDPSNLSKPVITNENLKLLQEYIFKQCDQLDGLRDHILNDPRDCHIDFSQLPICPDGKPGTTCFTPQQLTAIKSIYSSLEVNNKQIYPGFPFGLEAEEGAWDAWITGTSPFLQNEPSLHYMFGTNMYKYLIFNNPSWDYRHYDFKNYFEETRYASSYLDASGTDYNEFKKAKRKMIMYHGWNDPAISAFSTIQHYDEALSKDKDLPSYIRLFLLPGVLHCGGGTGPDHIDWIKHIQDWVENGIAPERLVLTKVKNGKQVMSRPVFPYPKIAVYTGKGDANLEQNFKVKSN